jgi:PAS domain S-box-containing protein
MSLPEPAEPLSGLLQTSRFGIIAVDAAGIFRVWNPGAERLLGWKKEELIGRPADAAFHLHREAQGELQLRLSRKDGSVIDVEVWTGPWRDPDGKDDHGTVAILAESRLGQDVEQKLARVQQELLHMTARETEARAGMRTERRFRELLEAAPDAIIEVDREGRMLLLNLATEKLFGYPREELLGQPVEILVPGAVRAGHGQHRANYWNHPVTRPMGSGLELNGRRKDGSSVPVEISLSPVKSEDGFRVTAVIRDITLRKRAEEKQREVEQRFRLMIEAVKDYAIFTLDSAGRVASWNAGAQRIKQYAAEEILGQHFSIFYPPEDRATKPAAELEVVRAVGKFEEEGWRVRKDGSRFWANVVITAVHNPAGEIVGFSKITRDLTDRKQAEDQLRVAHENYIHEVELRNREAERANQLKSEFLASMSHELRTPLHTIIGFSELLTEELEGPLNPKQQRFMNHIHTDSLHLLSLINDILDISKIESGRIQLRREVFDFIAVLEETLSSVRPQAAAKSIAIETSISIPAAIFADRLRVKQVLFNLLSNALKFTPAGGKIRIDGGLRDGFLEISVGDTGIGIPKEQHETVFDKFYQVGATTKGVREGTGLGLAISKALVEEHGGRIWLESEPGKGSRFTFTIALQENARENT